MQISFHPQMEQYPSYKSSRVLFSLDPDNASKMFSFPGQFLIYRHQSIIYSGTKRLYNFSTVSNIGVIPILAKTPFKVCAQSNAFFSHLLQVPLLIHQKPRPLPPSEGSFYIIPHLLKNALKLHLNRIPMLLIFQYLTHFSIIPPIVLFPVPSPCLSFFRIITACIFLIPIPVVLVLSHLRKHHI